MALWRCCRGRARAHQPPRAGALGHAKITGFGRWQLRSLNFARSIHRCAGDRAMQRGEWRESSAVGSRSGHPRVFPFSPPPSPRGFRRFVHSVDTHTNARTEVIEKQRQTTVSDAAQLQAASPYPLPGRLGFDNDNLATVRMMHLQRLHGVGSRSRAAWNV